MQTDSYLQHLKVLIVVENVVHPVRNKASCRGAGRHRDKGRGKW